LSVPWPLFRTRIVCEGGFEPPTAALKLTFFGVTDICGGGCSLRLSVTTTCCGLWQAWIRDILMTAV